MMIDMYRKQQSQASLSPETSEHSVCCDHTVVQPRHYVGQTHGRVEETPGLMQPALSFHLLLLLPSSLHLDLCFPCSQNHPRGWNCAFVFDKCPSISILRHFSECFLHNLLPSWNVTVHCLAYLLWRKLIFVLLSMPLMLWKWVWCPADSPFPFW